MTINHLKPNEQRTQSLRLDALALALTPLLVLIQGHRFGVGNQEFLIGFLRRLTDPNWLAGDWMMGTPMPHPQLLALISPVCQVLGESTTFLLLHLATRLLLMMGVWRLVLAVLPGRVFVAMCCMVMTLAEPRLRVGSHYLQGGSWEPAFLGMAVSVWLLAMGCRLLQSERDTATSDFWRLGIVGGLAVFSHLFIGGPVLVVVMGTLFFYNAKEWRFWGAFALALVIGSPAWFSAAKGFFLPEAGGLSGVEVIRVLQFRHPHHHQPWTWPLAHWMQWSAILGSTVFAWWRLRKESGKPLVIPLILLGWFLLTCAVFVVLGMWERVPIVAYLQPFRLFPLLWVLHSIALLALLEGVGSRVPRMAFLIGLAGVFLALRMVGLWGPFAVSVGLVLVALWKRDTESTRLSFAEKATPLPWSVGIAVGSYLMMFALQMSADFRTVVNSVKAEHWLATIEPETKSRELLAEWVHENTSPQDVFAIPPAMTGFRLLEERATVVDLKNVPYRALELKEWSARIGLAYNINPLLPFQTPPKTDPTAEQLITLAKTYGARFVLLREPSALAGVVFEAAPYRVIDVSLLEN